MFSTTGIMFNGRCLCLYVSRKNPQPEVESQWWAWSTILTPMSCSWQLRAKVFRQQGLLKSTIMVGLGGVVKVTKNKQMFASFYVVCFVIKSYTSSFNCTYRIYLNLLQWSHGQIEKKHKSNDTMILFERIQVLSRRSGC